MRIMFLILSLRDGGAERVLAGLSNEMVKKNDISVVTIHNNTDHYQLDKSIKRIRVDKRLRNEDAFFRNKLKKISIRRISSLIRIIKTERPDVIISFLPLPSLYIMLARRLSRSIKKIPIILSERSDPDKEYHNKIIALLAKRLYKNADGFVFQTNDAKNFYKDSIKCRTTIIENPINEIFLSHKTSNVRRKNIVSCGRLVAQKNYKLLIRAFSRVIKYYPQYILEIYGEGSQKDELLELARNLGIEDKVFLRGRVRNLADEISDAGIFVLSSDYEGMPNALMEAMALGIPCISTDCPVGGPKEIITDKKNGLLIDVGNEDQLVNAIKMIISDDELSLMLSKNGVRNSKLYEMKNVVTKWDRFIEMVINDRSEV